METKSPIFTFKDISSLNPQFFAKNKTTILIIINYFFIVQSKVSLIGTTTSSIIVSYINYSLLSNKPNSGLNLSSISCAMWLSTPILQRNCGDIQNTTLKSWFFSSRNGKLAWLKITFPKEMLENLDKTSK